MKKKYPPSLFVALIIGIFLTATFSILDESQKLTFPLKIILFAIVSILVIVLVLELFVYRRLKNQFKNNEQEIQKLKKLEVFRREFLGDVSHELKTPIFAVQGFIETLLDGALEDENVNRKFLVKAKKQTSRIANLVEDILTLSQIESGELAMKYQPFNIHHLVMEVLDSLEYKLTRKGRNINCTVVSHGLEEAIVIADPKRISQVLYNLIDNAIKYGDPSGTISVEMEAYGTQKIIIKVQDEGQGIAPEHIPRVFERFYRVDKSRSRDSGGTGLGLAIAKNFIAAHNEKILVKSELNKGTTFQFTLTKQL